MYPRDYFPGSYFPPAYFPGGSGTGPPRNVPTALHGDWEDLATDPDPEWALWEDV